MAIYAIDPVQAEVIHLFTGGSRSSTADFSEIYAIGKDLILLNIGGATLTTLNLKVVEEAISQQLSPPADSLTP